MHKLSSVLVFSAILALAVAKPSSPKCHSIELDDYIGNWGNDTVVYANRDFVYVEGQLGSARFDTKTLELDATVPTRYDNQGLLLGSSHTNQIYLLHRNTYDGNSLSHVSCLAENLEIQNTIYLPNEISLPSSWTNYNFNWTMMDEIAYKQKKERKDHNSGFTYLIGGIGSREDSDKDQFVVINDQYRAVEFTVDCANNAVTDFTNFPYFSAYDSFESRYQFTGSSSRTNIGIIYEPDEMKLYTKCAWTSYMCGTSLESGKYELAIKNFTVPWDAQDFALTEDILHFISSDWTYNNATWQYTQIAKLHSCLFEDEEDEACGGDADDFVSCDTLAQLGGCYKDIEMKDYSSDYSSSYFVPGVSICPKSCGCCEVIPGECSCNNEQFVKENGYAIGVTSCEEAINLPWVDCADQGYIGQLARDICPCSCAKQLA